MTTVQQFANAMGYIGALLKLRGRRLDILYRESHYHRINWDPNSGALTAPMASRRERRRTAKTMGFEFRPVYGYRGIDDAARAAYAQAKRDEETVAGG